MSYNSKYKGSEVEELLDSIGNKVDKVDGKQLSTEDFTTLLKQKLDGLSNYDDTAIQESVSKLRTDLDTLVSGDTTTAIKTFNEVIAFLEGISDTEDLASIIASIEQQIANKQDVITDLATIREGAALGATALQEVPSGYAKTSDLSVVSTGRTESTTGTMVIKEGYSYRHNLVCDAITDPNSFVEVFFNETYATNGNFAPFCQAGNGVVYIWSKSRYIDNNIEAVLRITPFIGPNGRTNAVSSVFAKKSDLTTKQDILVSGTNIKTINGESILGSGDLVIESVSDDIYYLDVDESNGIITAEEFENIKKCNVLIQRIVIDGIIFSCFVLSRKSDGTVFDDGITFAGVFLVDSDDPICTNILFTPNEDGSVNYTITSQGLYTFKTINGESIVGSGDIVISGGTSSGGAYAEVNHGTSDTTFTLTPNTFHVWDEVASLDLSFGAETSGVANEYLFQFTSGATATTLTLPSDIKWANDTPPTIAENMIYQISVLKGLASVLEFSNAAALIENKATIVEDTVVFEYPVASDVEVLLGDVSAYFALGEQTAYFDIPIGGSLETMQINGIVPSFDDVYKYTY